MKTGCYNNKFRFVFVLYFHHMNLKMVNVWLCCNFGHIWEAYPNYMNDKNICAHLYGRIKFTIDS